MLRLIPLSALLVLINSERATRWVTQQTITLMLGKPLSAPGYFDTGNLAQLLASMSPECMRAKEARRLALRALPPAHRECVRWLDRHREEHGLLSDRRFFDTSPRGHGGNGGNGGHGGTGGNGGNGGGPSGRFSKEALFAMLRHAAVPLKLIDALEAEIAISAAASAPRGGNWGSRGQGAQHGASGTRADWPRVLEHTWRALAAAQLAADCRQVIAELGTKDFELVVRSFAPLIWEPWLRLARRGALDKFARRLLRQVKKLYSRLSSNSKQQQQSVPPHELDASIAEFAHAIVDEHAYELLRSVLATTHEAALDDPLCAWLCLCLETHRTCSAPDLAIDVAELLAAGEQSTPDLRARLERCAAAAVAPMGGARNGARDGARAGAECGAAATVAPMGGARNGARDGARDGAECGAAATVARKGGARNGARDGARDGAECDAAAAVAPKGGRRGGGAESLGTGATTEDEDAHEDATDEIAAASTAERRQTRADELNILFGWFGEHGMPMASSDEVDASPQPPPPPLPQLPGIYMPRYVYAALRAAKAPTAAPATASSAAPTIAPSLAPMTAPMAEASTTESSHELSSEAAPTTAPPAEASDEVPPEAGPEEIPTEAIDAMLPLFEASVMRLLRCLAFHGDDGWKVAPGARGATSSETEGAVAAAAAANAAEEEAEMREAAAAAAEEEAWVTRVELAITELEGQAMAVWEHPEERGDGDAREVNTNPRSARPAG
jgi:hypothetical protein